MAEIQKSRAVNRGQKNRADAEMKARKVDAEGCAVVHAERERRAKPRADVRAEKWRYAATSVAGVRVQALAWS